MELKDRESLKYIMNRKSVRVYEDREVSEEIKEKLYSAIFQAPTAGNTVSYTHLTLPTT